MRKWEKVTQMEWDWRRTKPLRVETGRCWSAGDEVLGRIDIKRRKMAIVVW